MSKKALIAAPVHSVLVETLEQQGFQCHVQEKISREEAIEILRDCDGLVTSTRLLIDKEIIDAAPKLQFIGRMGSGMEIIDVQYANSKGIACYSSPEGNRNAVAEHALGMLLALNKKIIKSNIEVKAGIWKREENRGIELEGKTIGIIGFGNTGSAFAKILSGFDVNTLVYDKYNTENTPSYVNRCDALDEIFEKSDIISFHVPLTDETYEYVNEELIKSMKKPFVLLNTSRGKVVKTAAVLEGLKSGKISGVCLDVWEEEPISKMSETAKNNLQIMAEMPQAIITSHIAGYSVEALYKMSKILVDRIVNGL